MNNNLNKPNPLSAARRDTATAGRLPSPPGIISKSDVDAVYREMAFPTPEVESLMTKEEKSTWQFLIEHVDHCYKHQNWQACMGALHRIVRYKNTIIKANDRQLSLL